MINFASDRTDGGRARRRRAAVDRQQPDHDRGDRPTTHGGFGLIVSEVTRDASSPMHIHHTADESMWVVSGLVRVRCGEDEFTLAAGAFAFLPRGVPHTFIAEEDTTMLGLVSPGGSEAFFAEGGPVATTATPPPPDLERLQRAAERNRCEFVEPPLSPA